ncbi:hypothetical protein [Stappia sp. WLB 29]|uniref:hypothetical protein n=1 Tax=Stappia sp. WLB 29 TaxID=2925220 RepID=UPI0020BFFC0A|nr:hypothetical protein [Stappia sp. WLB 29]
MEAAAIQKCKQRLRIARKSLDTMKSCDNFTDFSDAWYGLLTASKNVYTTLDAGAKTSAQSRQWFGSVERYRKRDELLQYMFEARNDEEHGLGTAVELQPPVHEIGVAENGASRAFRIDGGPFRNVIFEGGNPGIRFLGGMPPYLKVTPLDDRPVAIRRTPATTILVEVHARGNRTYPPPASHNGQPLIDTSPIAVAELNLAYLETIVAEAEQYVRKPRLWGKSNPTSR